MFPTSFEIKGSHCQELQFLQAHADGGSITDERWANLKRDAINTIRQLCERHEGIISEVRFDVRPPDDEHYYYMNLLIDRTGRGTIQESTTSKAAPRLRPAMRGDRG